MWFYEWARKWNIPREAADDYLRRTAIEENRDLILAVDTSSRSSEASIQSRVRIEAARLGWPLWRNNVGATYTSNGDFIRYGLANDSSRLNKQIKSADLIGIRPVVITPAHVGLTIGQFVSREVKASNWIYRGTDREEAQLRWAEMVMALGGDAGFAIGEGTL